MSDYFQQEIFIYGSFLAAIILAVLLSRLLILRKSSDLFFDIFTNVGTLVILTSFAMARLDINLGRGYERFSGWTDNPNSLGLLLAPTLVMLIARLLQRRRRLFLFHLSILFMGIYVLVLTGSRASIGWVAISALAFVAARVRSSMRLVTLAFAGLIFIILGDSSSTLISMLVSRGGDTQSQVSTEMALSGRHEVWAIGMDLFRESPYLGYGLGSSSILLEERASAFITHQGLHFHSSYITSLVEIGIIGTLPLSVIIISAVIKGFQQTRYYLAAPSEIWPRAVLPWALLLGALSHAAVESWILSAGNANMFLLWVVVCLIIVNLQSDSRVYSRSNRQLPSSDLART